MKTTPALLCLALLAMAAAAHAQGTYDEDFTSDALKDTAATTADWDTAAGTFGLPAFTPALRGQIDVTGGHYGAVIDGDRLLQTTGGGFSVIDVTDPDAPVHVSTLNIVGSAFDIAVAGDLVATVHGSSGVAFSDISNPAAPVHLATVTLTGWANSIALEGDIAYVAASTEGIAVIDISNPAAPVLLVQHPVVGVPTGLDVDGNLLTYAAGIYGIRIYDVSTPSSPVPLGFASNGEDFSGAALSGDMVVAKTYESGLTIVDITNPMAPVIAGSEGLSTLGGFWVDVEGDMATTTLGYSGWAFYDISDPTAPVRTSTYSYPGVVAGSVVLDGDLAYLPDAYTTVSIVTIRQRVPATLTGSGTGFGAPQDMHALGDRAYIANSDNYFQIIDITDPDNPVVTGSCSTVPWTPQAVVAAGDHAYVGTAGPLYVIDISDPTAPSIVGTLATPSGSRDVDVSGDLAVIAAVYDGVFTVDVSNPAAPTLIGSLNRPTAVVQVELRGDIAYIGGGEGMEAVDVSNPASPVLMGAYPDQWSVTDMEIHGDRAYVRDFYYDLRIYDITNPASPALLSTHDFPNGLFGVDVKGNTAVVFDGFYGSWTFDITDPSAPVDLGLYQTGVSTNALCIDIVGDRAFMWDSYGRLEVVQLFQSDFDAAANVAQSLSLALTPDPISRVLVDADQTGDVSWEISATGGVHWQAVAADSTWTDIDEPGNDLRWRSTQEWAPDAPEVSHLTISWETQSTTGVSDMPGRSLVLHHAYPNPFNPQTRVSFEIPSTGHAALTIHDVRGRHVATLLDGHVDAGAHHAEWRGLDQAGRTVPAGVYFARLIHDGVTLTGRLTLVK